MNRPPRLAAVVVALVLSGWSQARAQGSDCTAPAPVCVAGAAVFAIGSAFDPMASAVRIGPDLLVTNRHVMADESRAEVRLPGGGSLGAQVVPSGYRGDLVLLRAEGLGDGPVLGRSPVLGGGGADSDSGPEARLYVIGLDLASRRVRAFAPGRQILAPAPGHALARLYHSAASQPGTSGGALVDETGRLAGFVASGGEGHNEAIPAAATRACIEALEHAARGPARQVEPVAESLELNCPESGNRQLVDLAAQAFGRAGHHGRAIALFERALAEDPNAINARIGLAVTLQLARHYEAAAPHLTWLLEVVPDNLQILRMATLSAKWGEDAALGARALALLETHHPLIAPSARKFLNNPSAAPARPAPPQ